MLENSFLRLEFEEHPLKISICDKRRENHHTISIWNEQNDPEFGQAEVWFKPFLNDETSGEDEDGAELSFIRFFPEQEVSVQLDYKLDSSKPKLRVRWRLMNRGNKPIPLSEPEVMKLLGLGFHGDAFGHEKFVSIRDSNSTLILDQPIVAVRAQNEEEIHSVNFPFRTLSPLTQEVDQINITVLDKALELQAVTDDFALSQARSGGVILHPMDDFALRTIVQTEMGGTVEANLDYKLGKEVILEDSSFDSAIIALVLKDDSGKERLRWIHPKHQTREKSEIKEIPDWVEEISSFPGLEIYESLETASIKAIELLLHHPQWKGWAACELTKRAIQSKDFELAILFAEQQMLCNGEFPLCYWQKSVALRHAIIQNSFFEETTSSLENLFYLAPMEVLIRAETFLNAPISMEPDASPLLQALSGAPELLIEPGRAYLELNLYEDADRWLGEAMRVHGFALGYLLRAYGLLMGPNMKVEAAEMIAKAKSCSDQPQAIRRQVEIQAIQKLAKAFPTDDYLSAIFKLIDQGAKPLIS